ncbi:2Fe-2S iron-sulfur cluster binding domain-containing protein [Aromatoleum toluvorans]|uniref:2Fe-2S iron-sulfur cluster binding domain-containing protein n=2 Tax=Aromatoleum toluvorans TaxID=92002 RepID=A0ABX1Q5T1_9RHOO|nr:2Fe-2S iron-sulfur cluster binding domain-containing protein [Aromatoleum toluvorans]
MTRSSTWEQAGIEWSGGLQKRLICCRVADETHDVKTFVFSQDDNLPFRFEPGQFITISVEIEGQAHSRCYTISSPPTRPYTLSITVKRVPGGVVSNWLHANLRPGFVINAHGPAGVFTPSSHPAEKSLYLSAGSGVTPLMSMTRAGIDLGLNRDVVFIHSARTPADIIFRKELTTLVDQASRLRVIHVCEDVGDEVGWSGSVGRLGLDLLEREVPDFRDREVFVCGPAGYMQAVKDLLSKGGHDPSRYHQESFNIEDGSEMRSQPEALGSGTPAGSYTVRLARSGKTFTIDSGQTVLAAAKKAGVAVASSCAQGLCGTCKATVLDGTVDMQHKGGIRQREVDKGLRLLCCSYPKSNLVIDL